MVRSETRAQGDTEGCFLDFDVDCTNLAERIEDVVKVYQDLPLGDLGNIVHGLTGIVSDSRILIGEAC